MGKKIAIGADGADVVDLWGAEAEQATKLKALHAEVIRLQEDEPATRIKRHVNRCSLLSDMCVVRAALAPTQGEAYKWLEMAAEWDKARRANARDIKSDLLLDAIEKIERYEGDRKKLRAV